MQFGRLSHKEFLDEFDPVQEICLHLFFNLLLYPPDQRTVCPILYHTSYYLSQESHHLVLDKIATTLFCFCLVFGQRKT